MARLIDQALLIRAAMHKAGGMLTDEQAREVAGLYQLWDSDWTGKRGDIVRDENELYRSIHDVGAGQNTKPSATPSMWTHIGSPADAWPEWLQPLGAHDAYAKNDKVSCNGKHWISTADGNVWAPGTYGWTEA